MRGLRPWCIGRVLSCIASSMRCDYAHLPLEAVEMRSGPKSWVAMV